MTSIMWIKLKGIKAPLEFEAMPHLVEILSQVLQGWSLCKIKKGKGRKPKIRLRSGPGGYERRSPWIEGGDATVLTDPVDAVCDLLLDVERAYIEDSGALLALHAAGVKMGRGLVAFPSTHASGKSLLSVALAEGGHQVFADDQLPILPGSPTLAQASGFLPRLRRPVPTDIDAKVQDFIYRHQGPKSDRFQYVALDPSVIAPVGEQAPIIAIVVLNRVEGAVPKIEPLGEAEVLKTCVLQSFGRSLNALEVLDHLHAMVKESECVKLTYSTVLEARTLLEEKFS